MTLLSLEVNAIDIKIWEASVILVFVILSVLLGNRKKGAVKIAKSHDFDPVSLGTLWFSFALSIWVTQQTKNWYTTGIEILISVGALAFLIAVFSWSMRDFLNTKASAIVIPLTLIAFIFGFALGWLPALSQVSGILLDVILCFGFLWVVVMLFVMFRDLKKDLARIMFVIFFVIAGVIKFCQGGLIGILGFIILIGIGAISYLIATGRIHVYGEVSE